MNIVEPGTYVHQKSRFLGQKSGKTGDSDAKSAFERQGVPPKRGKFRGGASETGAMYIRRLDTRNEEADMGMTQAQRRLIDAAERRRAAEAFAREYAAWRAEQRAASNLNEDERNWQPIPPMAVVGLAIGAIVLGCTLPAAIVFALIRLIGGMV